MRRTSLLLVAALAALAAAVPATAATPTFKGTVGPGFTIAMAKKPRTAGKIVLVVSDKSDFHNFHLTGPGVNVKTAVPAIGSKTFKGHAQEGHLPVRLRPARERDEGLIQGVVDHPARGGCGARLRSGPQRQRDPLDRRRRSARRRARRGAP